MTERTDHDINIGDYIRLLHFDPQTGDLFREVPAWVGRVVKVTNAGQGCAFVQFDIDDETDEGWMVRAVERVEVALATEEGGLVCPCGNNSDEENRGGFGLCDPEGKGLPDSANSPGGPWIGHVKCVDCCRYFFASDDTVPAGTPFPILGRGQAENWSTLRDV